MDTHTIPGMGEREREHLGKTYPLSPAHPEADRWPWLEGDELQELADDIAESGLDEPIRRLADGRIVDGRNRELACFIAGVAPEYTTVNLSEIEIRGLVRRKNALRRHVSRELRRELIADVLRENPEKSNRAVASETGASDKTVSAVRTVLESTAEIPQLSETKGRDGKTRPAKAKKPKPANASPSALGDVQVEQPVSTESPNPFADLASRVRTLATDTTWAVNGDDDASLKLRIIMTVCGLMDYPSDAGSDKNPRVLPFAGMHALYLLAGKPGPLPPEEEILLIYHRANGSWVPPLTEKRRAKKRQRKGGNSR